MLSALNAAGAEYLLVGAHALAVHGLPRATGDLGLWVRPRRDNAERVFQALREFRAPLDGLTIEDLATPGVVFQIGVVPLRIDILTAIDGVRFEDGWPRRTQTRIDDIPVSALGREDLIVNKRAAGRPKDLADLAWLEEGRAGGG